MGDCGSEVSLDEVDVRRGQMGNRGGVFWLFRKIFIFIKEF